MLTTQINNLNLLGAIMANKGAGRPMGSPNKATTDARQAIGSFVDGNAHRLTQWLDKVAEGVQDDEGNFIVPPNPAKAFDMFQSVVEYHVPKLARMEVSGNDKHPLVVEANLNVFGELLKNIKLRRQSE
jgi:hypothetical protein